MISQPTQPCQPEQLSQLSPSSKPNMFFTEKIGKKTGREKQGVENRERKISFQNSEDK